MNEDTLVQYIQALVDKQPEQIAKTQRVFVAISKDTHQLTVTNGYQFFDSVPIFVEDVENFSVEVEKASLRITSEKPKPSKEKEVSIIKPSSWVYVDSPEMVWLLYSTMRNASEYHLNRDFQENMFNQAYNNYMNGLVKVLHKLQHSNSASKLIDIYPDHIFIAKRFGTTSDCRLSKTGYPLFAIDTLRVLEEGQVDLWEKNEFKKEAAIGMAISQWNLPSFRKVYGLIETMNNFTSYVSERYTEYNLEDWLSRALYDAGNIYKMLSLLANDLFFVGVRFGYVSFKNIQVLVLLYPQKVQFSKFSPLELSGSLFRVVGYEFVKTIEPKEAHIKKHVIKTITWLFNRICRFKDISRNILVRLQDEIKALDYNKFKSIENVDPETVFLPRQKNSNNQLFSSMRDIEVYFQLFPQKPFEKEHITNITNVLRVESNELINELNQLKMQEHINNEDLVTALSKCYRLVSINRNVSGRHQELLKDSVFTDLATKFEQEYNKTIINSNLHKYKKESNRFQDKEFLDQLNQLFREEHKEIL